MTFKEQYRDLQEIVRELSQIRNHNLRFKEDDPQDKLFLFAEASLCLLALERFLRILPDLNATEQDTLYNLLERATCRRLGLLHFIDLNSTLPITDESRRQQIIKEITTVRNTWHHGNYEQAVQQAELASIREYFKTQFVAEIETLYKITDSLIAQIDPSTGQPYKKGNAATSYE